MSNGEIVCFRELYDGDVFVFVNDYVLCVKEIFPGQAAAEDLPVPNFFQVNFPKNYAHSGGGMRVVKFTTLEQLSKIVETLTKAGLIE